MKLETYKEIRACLPEGKSPFIFYKDRYAIDQLRWALRGRTQIRDLKAGSHGRLLNRPVVKDLLARAGGKAVDAALFASYWPRHFEPFDLSVAEWSGNERWGQTSRPGSNLVLQLNFTNKHDADFLRVVKPHSRYVFNYTSHPSRRPKTIGRGETLAWSRLDFDLDANEALIEEVQSDWVRLATQCAKEVNDYPDWIRSYAHAGPDDMQRYAQLIEENYLPIWAEAMLSATLVFLRDELGLTRIWMHEPQTGAVAKGIQGRRPPRSLYTSLPKKFGFKLTHEGPNFICKYRSFRRKISAVEQPRWHYLEV